ncbi:hypothetical protein CGMCC3_g12015 [Colletotrichum fructicola]|nr:uncharacterized protein CGMCC3_g12015 [Colletotrichum fructicola]KAE9571864.1 hypothetical protein CGMCC3_g12015 [Colletotrichum fructicola]
MSRTKQYEIETKRDRGLSWHCQSPIHPRSR